MRFRNSIEFIFYKVYADIRAEAARSYLGLLWWLIEPVLYLGAFYVLFVMVLQRGGKDYVPTFLCGIVVWKWFASGLQGGSQSITTHRGLLLQVRVPKLVFPVIAVLGSMVRFIPVFLIFTVFILWYGINIKLAWLAAPILILIQFFLVVTTAMLVGSVTPFIPDLKAAINNGLLLLFFMSGIFFNINQVHEPLKSYLFLNPMAVLIDEYRNVMIRGVWPDIHRLTFVLAFSIITATLSFLLLKRLDQKFGKAGF